MVIQYAYVYADRGGFGVKRRGIRRRLLLLFVLGVNGGLILVCLVLLIGRFLLGFGDRIAALGLGALLGTDREGDGSGES